MTQPPPPLHEHDRPPVSPSNRLRRQWALAGVLLLAVAAAFVGLEVAPLDAHEIFVVQTARQMSRRGDWIVPYFNGQPRLNKPPLNYWLTWASGEVLHGGRITGVDGRIPSALAGVWMVAMTFWCGRMLFGRSVGLWAGALLATTAGFSEYTHSARPEMVYASLCVTAIALFVASWRSPGHEHGHGRGRRQRSAAWGMWACFGLATLAKGPHVPAALLMSFVAALALHPPSRPKMLAVLRPVAGLMILVAIAAPWWLAIGGRLGMDTLCGSELAGERFRLSPFNLLDPYYLYRTWALLLPWVPLFPGAAWLVVHRSRFGYAARFLGLVLLAGVVLLGIGGGKRWYYMLPYAAPLCLLMSLALRDAMAAVSAWLTPARARSVLAALALAGAGGGMWIVTTLDASRAGAHAQSACWMMLGAVALMATIAASRFSADALSRWRRARALAVSVIVSLSLVGAMIRVSATMDSPDRWSRAAFGRLVADQVPAGDTIGAYRVGPAFAVYYGPPVVTIVPDIRRWANSLLDSDARRWLCFPGNRLEEVSHSIPLAAVYEIKRCDGDRSWMLGLVGGARTAMRRAALGAGSSSDSH